MRRVAAGDPHDRPHDVAVGVGIVDGQAELPPVAGQDGGDVLAVERAIVMGEADGESTAVASERVGDRSRACRSG